MSGGGAADRSEVHVDVGFSAEWISVRRRRRLQTDLIMRKMENGANIMKLDKNQNVRRLLGECRSVSERVAPKSTSSSILKGRKEGGKRGQDEKRFSPLAQSQLGIIHTINIRCFFVSTFSYRRRRRRAFLNAQQ